MKRIDDNTLAAYLEGTLPDEDREWVEQAIEEDDELKAVVDEWIAMSDAFCDNSMALNNDASRMEACRSIGTVIEQIKAESGQMRVAAQTAMPAYAERAACASPTKPKKPIIRRVLIAASLLAFVGVTAIWLLQGPTNDSSTNFDIPLGGDDYMMATPEFETDEDTLTIGDNSKTDE